MTGWGSVIAIEAPEPMLSALAGNIAINNCFNAHIILAAIADKPGVMKLPKNRLTAARRASGSVRRFKKRQQTEFIGQSLDYSEQGAMRSRSITLGFAQSHARRPGRKINVEGMEFDVLAEAGQPPEAVRPYIIRGLSSL